MDNNQNRGNGPKGGPPNEPNNGKMPKNGQNIVIFLIVSLLALVVINLFNNMLKDSTETKITYNKFMEMVENGEVDKVTIRSNEIVIVPKKQPLPALKVSYITGRMDDEFNCL